MQVNGNMLVSSGIVPIMLKFIDAPIHEAKVFLAALTFFQNITKAFSILDGACYAWHALPSLVEVSGITIIVQKINVAAISL